MIQRNQANRKSHEGTCDDRFCLIEQESESQSEDGHRTAGNTEVLAASDFVSDCQLHEGKLNGPLRGGLSF